MIKNRRRSTLSLALVLLLAVPQLTVAQQDDYKGLILVCGAIAGGIASYQFLSWLFTKTDQQLLEQAEDNLKRISSDYANMVNVYPFGYVSHAQDLPEHTLNAMARERAGQHDIALYLDYMYKAIGILRADKKEISSRLRSAEKNEKQMECYAAMKLLENKISQYDVKIEVVYRALHLHRAYFALYDLYAELSLRHGSVAQVFNYSYNSAKDFEYSLKTAVMAYDYRRSEKYPYMRYVELLAHDSRQFDHAFSACAYAYHDLLAVSRQLREVLERAKQALVVTKEYEQNVRDYQRAQREQKMLEEQRRQTEALQRQARAQEEQAREVARQNRLKEKELQLQRDKERQESWSARISLFLEN